MDQDHAGEGRDGAVGHDAPKLVIIVNRRKYGEHDGVKHVMTGGLIAALVDVPVDVAVVRRGDSGDSPEVGIDEKLQIVSGESFLVTRRIVEGGAGKYPPPERVARELEALAVGGQRTAYFEADRPVVVYHEVPTGGAPFGLPETTDVLVPVPAGYPASMIDLAALPIGSPFLARVKGGANSQGMVVAGGVQWQLASYHPHNNGGGPPWDQLRHGFHTYFDHLLSWLSALR